MKAELKLNIEQDFPILKRLVNNKPLVYLDSAATSLTPRQVVNAITRYYEEYNANVHRGLHTLSQEATEAYENARKKIAAFINAEPEEVVFTKNATEAINLVAKTLNPKTAITVMEHHSNYLPWNRVAVISAENGELNLEEIKEKIKGVDLLAVTHISNVLGTVNPIKEIIKTAHEQGVKVLVDGAQAVVHMPVDVKELDADYYVFSGHKMFGPTGIGVLYAKKDLLEQMQPFLKGGDMVKNATTEKWNDLPWKFEAGTPPIAEAIALGAAVDYIQNIGLDKIHEHTTKLTEKAVEELQKLDNIIIYGPSKRAGIVTFNLKGIHSHDVVSLLDNEGIAVRGGHHCAQPLMEALKIKSCVRASFNIYNKEEDVQKLVEAVKKVQEVFA